MKDNPNCNDSKTGNNNNRNNCTTRNLIRTVKTVLILMAVVIATPAIMHGALESF